MTDFDNNVWELLARNLPLDDRLKSKEIFTELTNKLSCAVGSSGERHFLVVLTTADAGLTDNQSRGLSVTTRDLCTAHTGPRRYIDITCEDPGGYSAFDLLGRDIANALGNGNCSPSAAISRVLEKWRRFWSRLIGRQISRAEEIGLFAELWFLSEWLIPDAGAEIVHSWQGPFGHRNDFENDRYCVEVKATTSGRGRIFHVNSVEQLEDPQNGCLYLFGARLNKTKNQGRSIPALVSEIREQLTDQYEALDHLEEGLVSAGYSDIHATTREWVKFQMREACLFEVKEDFPRLDGSSPVPTGIERIEYEINLNTFDHLIVARSPSEWNP